MSFKATDHPQNRPPVEIIEQNKRSFNINPYHGEGAAELMVDFFEKCQR